MADADAVRLPEVAEEDSMADSVMLILQQIKTLIWKSWKYTLNNIPITFVRLFFGVACIVVFGLVLVFASSGENQHPTASPSMGGIPRCRTPLWNETLSCVTLLYSPPDDVDVQEVMAMVGANNSPVLSVANSTVADVTSFDIQPTTMSVPELQQWFETNPNVTQGAVYFEVGDGGLDVTDLRYTILYNGTTYSDPISFVFPEPYMNYQYQTQVAVDSALIQYFTGADVSIDVAFKDFPSTTSAALQGLLYALIEVILFLAYSLPFIFVVMQVNAERASGQRGYMKLVGLTDFPWWVATALDHNLFYFLLMSFTLVAGYLWYPWLDYFWNASLLVHMFIALAYGFSMYTMAILITTLIKDKRFVVIVAFCVLVFGLSVAFMLMFGDAGMLALWDPGFTHSFGPWGLILSMFPPTALTYAIMEVKLQTWGYVWLTNRNANIISTFTVADMYTVPDDLTKALNASDWYIPTVNYFLVLMFVNGIIYLLLALYFDQVLSDPYRASQPWYYFVTPAYWGLTKPKPRQVSGEKQGLLSGHQYQDPDVEEEMRKAKESDAALRVDGLIKIFNGGRKYVCCGQKKADLVAVDHLYLTAEYGTLLCILGHNGAGKTTAINIMTGVTRSSGGEAYILNSSITTNMEHNRKFMGVCPQFDVLWEDLTAREHLYLITGLKREGMISRERAGEVLDDVRLLNVADRGAKTYSGGMKRRLSLAMSISTDPKVIFMDEPTTGMDPGNRRHIWETILKVRKGRLVVLTTHSMEEADVLGDKIAIMSSGKLRCVGNSLHLKAKYGCGYRLSLLTPEHQVERVRGIVSDLLPEAVLQTNNAGNLIYSLDTSDLDKSAAAFASLREATYEDPSGMTLPLINDWGIANTTLEDVFIRTTHDDEEEKELATAKALNGAGASKAYE